MLKQLSIKNYAIINDLNVHFDKGLTTITGETGAGKSILLGALSLLTGKRADTEVLKDKNSKCIVEAVFQIQNYNLKSFFEENEIDYDDETIIRREISNNGKSRAFVNDTPVVLNVIKDLGAFLIDIHSQNETQILKDKNFQIEAIDIIAGIENEVQEYQHLLNQYNTKKEILERQSNEISILKEKSEFLEFQFNELESAKLKPDELPDLEEQFSILSNVEEIRLAIAHANTTLLDDEQSILTLLNTIAGNFNRIKHFSPEIESLFNRLESCYIELKDISNTIIGLNDTIEADPEKLNAITERINLINNLLTKYKVADINKLIELKSKINSDLEKITFSDVDLKKLKEEISSINSELLQKANVISEKRKKIIPEIQQTICTQLADLALKRAVFKIELSPTNELNSYGQDKIEYLFSANNEENLQPISKVASGGEMSRFMLSLKYLLSAKMQLPTIIFDEIDTGVSGEVAHKMGLVFRDMANKIQIINITHLPQVAAKGNQHFNVFKTFNGNETETKLKLLTPSERKEEIAKMLSGEKITEAALKNAEDLLGYG